MLPRETIATADIPDGETLTLVSHGRDFVIMLGRDELMGTRMQFSMLDSGIVGMFLVRQFGEATPIMLIHSINLWGDENKGKVSGRAMREPKARARRARLVWSTSL